MSSSSSQDMTKSLGTFKQSAEDQLARLGAPEKEMQDKVIDTAEQLSLLHELMKDFSAYEQMFKVQGNIAEQSKAFNRPGSLSREDQLSLKSMAGVEHEIEEELKALTQKLRDDAKEAEAQFPKASSSAQSMADNMEQLRLSHLANQSTESMLAAQGQQSNQRSERLRSEMESLCSDCQGGEGESSNEADGYLTAKKNLNPGKTMQQMKSSQKFGNKPGKGKGKGKGEGEGQSGGTLAEASRFDVFGNESLLQQPMSYRKGNRNAAPGTSLAENSNNPEAQKDKRRGLDPSRHATEAMGAESVADEYRTIVDQYFKAIVK
jgi:hypothetical protein